MATALHLSSRSLRLALAFWLGLTALPVRAQVASLAADLAPGSSSVGTLGVEGLSQVGDRVLLVGGDRTVGGLLQLHATAGEAGDLSTLAEGFTSLERAALVPGRAFYWARNRQGVARLLVSDGTPEGTRTVGPELVSFRAMGALPARGLAFFEASTSLEEVPGLWGSDGTPGGTRLLADAGKLGGRAFDSRTVDLGDRLGLVLVILPGGGEAVRTELWLSDGTPFGTRRVTALPELWSQATPFGNGFLFWQLGADGPAELWRSDGTAAGTTRLAAFAGRPQELSYEIAVVGQRAFFLADNGIHGIELWAFEGATGRLRRLSGFPAKVPFDSGLGFRQKLVALGDRVVFAADDGVAGTELWESRGTPATTRRVADLCPGACSGVGAVGFLEKVGESVVFSANLSGLGFEAWSYRPGAGAPALLRDLCPGPCGGLRSRLGRLGEDLVLHVATSQGPADRLAVTDGTSAGTQLLAQAPLRLRPLDTLLPDVPLAEAGGRAVLALGGHFQEELWAVGRTAGDVTRLYRRLAVWPASSQPERLVELDGQLLVTACRDLEERWLRLEGEGPGSVELARLGTPCGSTSNPPRKFVGARLGGQVFFENGGALWVSDGTAAGTLKLFEQAEEPVLLPPIEHQGRIWFAARLPSGFVQLASTDGSLAGTRREISLPGYDAFAALQSVGSELLVLLRSTSLGWEFFATDGAPGPLRFLASHDLSRDLDVTADVYASETHAFVHTRYTLPGLPGGEGAEGVFWATDGTPAGTVRLPGYADFRFDYGGRASAVVVDETLLYTAVNQETRILGLFRSDGTLLGTELVAELLGIVGAGPLVQWQGRVWFLRGAYTPEPAELWSSDGTAAGTRAEVEGLPTGHPQLLDLFATDAGLLFALGEGFERSIGNELWVSDGTPTGTRLLHDIQPGSSGATPAGFARVGDDVYFSASDSVHGRELWRLSADLTPTACVPSETVLCLGAGRFRVELAWFDDAGNVGAGRAVPLSADTGSFWFFSPDNLEALVKVLDGTEVNDRFWVFHGALSDVQQVLTVTDTATGAARRYGNAQGQFRSYADVEAFAPDRVLPAAPFDAPASLAPVEVLEAVLLHRSFAACASDPQALPLLGGRFAATVELEDPNVPALAGQPIPWSPDAGFFWFFGPSNLEVAVKMVDGTAVNGKAWVFSASLSNLGYRLTVTDCTTGTLRTYRNTPGRFASFADTGAF